jgi:hypothetical protein
MSCGSPAASSPSEWPHAELPVRLRACGTAGARARRHARLARCLRQGRMRRGASTHGQATLSGPALKSSPFGRIQGDGDEVKALDNHVGQWLAPVIQVHDRRARRARSISRDRYQWGNPAAFRATACLMHERSQRKSSRRTIMWLKPSHRIALTASCLRIALLPLASAQEHRHAATIPRSDEPRPVLDLAGHTNAGIDQGREANTIGQKRRDGQVS